jgi:hypothetical protein
VLRNSLTILYILSFLTTDTREMIDIGAWFDDSTVQSTDSCALVTISKQHSIPLKSRVVNAVIYAEQSICEVTEELSYLSDEDCTAKFIFPLPSRSAVYK